MIPIYVIKFILGHRQYISHIHFAVGLEIFKYHHVCEVRVIAGTSQTEQILISLTIKSNKKCIKCLIN